MLTFIDVPASLFNRDDALPPKTAPKTVNVAAGEISQFNALAASWWDESGPMAPLHRMNPARLRFITQALTAHFGKIEGLNILDVGCGGGLVAEALARLGAKVTGIDGAGELIAIARTHAVGEGLKIDYRSDLTDILVGEKKRFHAVLALEVIEHVPDPAQFTGELAELVVPGGLVILSTLNRSLASLAFGVGLAEYVLGWLPRGTHDWRKFLKPSELYHICRAQDLEPLQTMGLVFNPAKDVFELDERKLNINYFLTATRK